jgi:hypothetical protein
VSVPLVPTNMLELGDNDSLQKYCFTKQTEAQASDYFKGILAAPTEKCYTVNSEPEAGDPYAPRSLCLTQERPGIEVPLSPCCPFQLGLWSILPFQIFGIEFT